MKVINTKHLEEKIIRFERESHDSSKHLESLKKETNDIVRDHRTRCKSNSVECFNKLNERIESKSTITELDIQNLRDEKEGISLKIEDIKEKINKLDSELNKIKSYEKKGHEYKIECDKCGDSFDHLSGLDEHIANMHESEDPFNCEKSDLKFYSKLRLKRHEKSHHYKGLNRHCHYFNSRKKWPFQQLGCKF